MRAESYPALPEAVLDAEPPKTLGADERRDVGPVPDDLRRPAQVEEIAALEIDEDERRPRIREQIAERVEVAVPREIGDGQHVAVDANEAPLAAPVGDVHPPFRLLDVRGAGDEEDVGSRDGLALRGAEAPQRLDRGTATCGRTPDLAQVDVLRTVAEALPDIEDEAIRSGSAEDAVRAIAPASREIDAQDSGGPARGERPVRGIVRIQPGGNPQRVRIGRGDEPRFAVEQRCRGPAALERSDGDERQHREERAVLLGEEVADAAALRASSSPRLGFTLSRVEGPSAHATIPVGRTMSPEMYRRRPRCASSSSTNRFQRVTTAECQTAAGAQGALSGGRDHSLRPVPGPGGADHLDERRRPVAEIADRSCAIESIISREEPHAIRVDERLRGSEPPARHREPGPGAAQRVAPAREARPQARYRGDGVDQLAVAGIGAAEDVASADRAALERRGVGAPHLDSRAERRGTWRDEGHVVVADGEDRP